MRHLKEIYEYRDMVGSLVKRELRGKYEKSVLGFLWSFLSPMFQILIYNLVFTHIFQNNMPNYYIYLMSGILTWTFFSDSLAQGTGAIVYNAEMVKKIYFPREVLVISEVTAKLVNMLLSFIVMAVFLVISGVGFSVQLIVLPVVIIIEYIMCLGFSLIVSSVTVYLRDLEYVENVILMAWIWGTPIMYAIDGIQDPLMRRLLFINPMTSVISCYHYIFYYHVFPSLRDILIPFAEAMCVLVAGYFIFKKLNRRFVEEL